LSMPERILPCVAGKIRDDFRFGLHRIRIAI
jgi:hypothetical protein